jgi:hypothetical protein
VLLHQSLRNYVPSTDPTERQHVDVIYARMARTIGQRQGANLVRTERIRFMDSLRRTQQAWTGKSGVHIGKGIRHSNYIA